MYDQPSLFQPELALATIPSRPALTLRPYQQQALDAVEAGVKRGIRRPLVAMATGSGKTVCFAHQARDYGRTLVIAHRDELLQQAADKIRMVDPNAQIGLVRAESNETGAQIIVASIQTISRPNRMVQLPRDFALVVADEAHHSPSASWRSVLEYLGCFRDDGPITVGYTATPERGDKVGLGSIFQEIVFTKDILEMIEEGYLCDLRALQVKLKFDLGSVHVSHGDYVDSELGDAMMEADAPLHAAEVYLQYASDRKALVFTPTVAMAYATAQAFKDAGVASEAVDGETRRDERREILERFHTGQTRVLVNVAVLIEGFDEPSVDCIFIARPTRSAPLYKQLIGRGTRLYPGKENCLIIDMVGATTRHDLQTVASLLGISPDALAKRSVVEVLAERKAQVEQARTRPLGEVLVEAVDLFKHRSLKWIPSDGRFVLGLGETTFILEPQGGMWRVVRKDRGAPYVTMGTDLDLGYAQGMAEDYAHKTKTVRLVDPDAAWRQGPPSEKQLELMEKLGIVIPPNVTKGEASDAITAQINRRRR